MTRQRVTIEILFLMTIRGSSSDDKAKESIENIAMKNFGVWQMKSECERDRRKKQQLSTIEF